MAKNPHFFSVARETVLRAPRRGDFGPIWCFSIYYTLLKLKKRNIWVMWPNCRFTRGFNWPNLSQKWPIGHFQLAKVAKIALFSPFSASRTLLTDTAHRSTKNRQNSVKSGQLAKSERKLAKSENGFVREKNNAYWLGLYLSPLFKKSASLNTRFWCTASIIALSIELEDLKVYKYRSLYGVSSRSTRPLDCSNTLYE